MSLSSFRPTKKLKPLPKKTDWSGAFHPGMLLALPPLFRLVWRILWAKLSTVDKTPLPSDHAWARGVVRNFDKRCYTASLLIPDGGLVYYLVALYVVLRVADTIEDDTVKSAATRRKDLANIYRFLDDPDYQPSCEYGVNQKELDLMRSLPRVRSYCAQLSPSSRTYVIDCCRLMCEGMAKYLPDDCDQDPALIKDFNDLELYSYGSSGQPQMGIFRFFVAQGYDSEDILPTKTPSTHPTDWAGDWGIAIFLQEAFMIVDVASDTLVSRYFWPKSLVQKYVKDQRDLFLPENEHLALDCLNEFIIHTLGHVVPALSCQGKHKYPIHLNLQQLPFLFHMINLALYYNNPDVFRFKLKSNVVELAYVVGICQDFEDLVQQTKVYVRKILAKSDSNDGHRLELEKAVHETLSGCDILLRKEKRRKSTKIFNSNDIFWWAFFLICALYFMYLPKC